MVNDYVSNLRKLRANVGQDTENLSVLERAGTPGIQTERGLMNRPKSSQNLDRQRAAKTLSDPESNFEAYVKEMESIRAEVSRRARGNSTSVPSFGKEASAVKLAEEALGKKQEKRVGDTFTAPRTVGEVSDRIRSTAATVSFALPEEVKKDTGFLSSVKRLASKYNIKESDLLALMHFETGGTFDPSTKNKQKGQTGTGLIQFVESTANGLGTSTAELASMSRVKQMAFVEKYLDQYAGKISGGSRDDLYMAVLWPAAIGKPRDHVLFQKGTTQYEKNAGLDLDQDGSITKEEAARRAFS